MASSTNPKGAPRTPSENIKEAAQEVVRAIQADPLSAADERWLTNIINTAILNELYARKETYDSAVKCVKKVEHLYRTSDKFEEEAGAVVLAFGDSQRDLAVEEALIELQQLEAKVAAARAEGFQEGQREMRSRAELSARETAALLKLGGVKGSHVGATTVANDIRALPLSPSHEEKGG